MTGAADLRKIENVAVATLREKILDYYHLKVSRAFIQTGDVKTFYFSVGSGKPLVLLHGSGGGGVLWAPVLAPLAVHFRLIVPDVIGFGESDKPDGAYDRRFYADWLRRFLDAVGLEKTSLVGNSQGGAIALQFAMDCPHRVDNLVLVCSAGFKMRGLNWRAILEMLLAHLFLSRRMFRRLTRYLVHDVSQFPLDTAVQYLMAVCRLPGGTWAVSKGRGRAVRPFKGDALSRITCPTLILWGSEDRIIRKCPITSVNPPISGAKLVQMAGAGHTPFIDQPEKFTQLLVEFIR